MEGYVFEASITNAIPIGVVGADVRMDVHVEGTITEGLMAGGTVTGIDHLLMRADGVGVLDVRELIRTPDGAVVALTALGYAVPPFDMPPPDRLTSPDMQWPDVDVPLHGAATMQTGVPALAEVNRTVFGFTGTVNMARGQIRVRGESLARVPVT
ncbi:DUF3237 family protein [Geodermatophilus sp. SYSU D00758]